MKKPTLRISAVGLVSLMRMHMFTPSFTHDDYGHHFKATKDGKTYTFDALNIEIDAEIRKHNVKRVVDGIYQDPDKMPAERLTMYRRARFIRMATWHLAKVSDFGMPGVDSKPNTIVRGNMLDDVYYRPYCGVGDGSCSMPRVDWNNKIGQMVCPECGFISAFPPNFIAEYRAKHNLPTP